MDGNDVLEAALATTCWPVGDDQMTGGAGDDTYQVDSVGDVVVEAAGGGTDTVYTAMEMSLADHLENLRLTGIVERGTGNAADNLLVGNDNNNQLFGLAGNDVLDGGRGADILTGGDGNDTYVVDNIGDMVVEAEGQGTDTVRSRISLTLAANTENLVLTGINAINGTGNDQSNVIVGNVSANTLDGG
jgi:Ca2+-binding RTX toxin-like protein